MPWPPARLEPLLRTWEGDRGSLGRSSPEWLLLQDAGTPPALPRPGARHPHAADRPWVLPSPLGPASWACCNRGPKTGALKQQDPALCRPWRLKSETRGPAGPGVLWGLQGGASCLLHLLLPRAPARVTPASAPVSTWPPPRACLGRLSCLIRAPVVGCRARPGQCHLKTLLSTSAKPFPQTGSGSQALGRGRQHCFQNLHPTLYSPQTSTLTSDLARPHKASSLKAALYIYIK